MNEETIIQNNIRLGCNDLAVLFRANVGTFKVADRYISTGLPKGFPDLFGIRKSDGKFIAIEVKTKIGKLRAEQKLLLNMLKENGAIAGVARSVDDARKIISGGATCIE
jgi:hypothetical protein